VIPLEGGSFEVVAFLAGRVRLICTALVKGNLRAKKAVKSCDFTALFGRFF